VHGDALHCCPHAKGDIQGCAALVGSASDATVRAPYEPERVAGSSFEARAGQRLELWVSPTASQSAGAVCGENRVVVSMPQRLGLDWDARRADPHTQAR